jgi:hydroxyacylglutathione hydrolase
MTVQALITPVEARFATGDVEIVQFQTPGLGDNSYLLRSGDEAAIVDPQRDLDRFRQALAERAVRLVAVVETHVHNDYVSGGPALAREHGATYVVPAEAGYELEHRGVRDGDELRVGSVRLRALHTPGHTPHHLTYEVVEGADVRAVFSGGSVLVGACGRTDLVAPEMTESLTRQQYRSAQRIGRLPAPAAIAPTHGAGSFCSASAALSETWTTVEKERLRNPAYLARDEEEFVRDQLAGLLAYPDYYAQMAPINRRGATEWEPSAPPRIGPDEVERLVADGAVLVDGRPRHVFAAGHIGGAVNVELDPQLGTYLGWLYPFGTRFVLVVGPEQDAGEAARQMARIGLETIAGVIGVEEWRDSGQRLQSSGIVDVDGLRRALERGGVRVLDVRQDLEWRDGHIPGARHIHIPDLPGRAGELAGEEPVYVYCRSGHRATMGASILAAAGIPAVAVDGGFPDWRERGYPVE